ncbi:MAG: hypothetical protein GY777_03720 [Candidatus Brocadiaceae bacterium]|nr:hypothetical protein [Candidatus Brocadiaceae bacterium]
MKKKGKGGTKVVNRTIVNVQMADGSSSSSESAEACDEVNGCHRYSKRCFGNCGMVLPL